ncbi:MAG: hypothetical protein ACFCUO_05280 [Rhodospirillales bacterium]
MGGVDGKAPGGGGAGEVLFEFHWIGGGVRVSAIDPRTNVEVTIVGAPGVGEEALKRLAARKLAYVLAKKRSD